MRKTYAALAAALLAVPLVASSVTASEAASYRGYGKHTHNSHSYAKKPSWKHRRYYGQNRKYRYWRFGNFRRHYLHNHHHHHRHHYR